MSHCAVCAGPLAASYPVRDLLLETTGTWTFAQCTTCGHGQLDPLPDHAELVALYSALYTPDNQQIMERLGTSWFERGLHKRRLQAIAAASPTIRNALDVGCGLGFWLAALGEQFGCERTGLDLSESAVARAREIDPGATIVHGAFDDDAPAGPFDLVTLQHVLEHVPDPRSTVAQAARRLDAGGLLQIEVPQISGWGRRLFGRWYWGHLPPQHLHLLSHVGLRTLLGEAGLELVSSHTSSYPGLFTTTLVLFVRFTVGSKSRHASNWLVRGPVVLAGFSVLPLAVLLDLTVGPVLGWLGRGDVLTVVARKR
jgi:SAM-dependent methyltransferase